MWTDKAKTLIARHEGIRLAPYKDSLGIPTIGIGFNMSRPDARSRLAQVGLSSWAPPIRLTMAQAFQLLDLEFINCEADVRQCVYRFDDLTDNRKIVLCDMRFNLGPMRFRAFAHMLAAVNDDNFVEAASQMLASVWATQVGARAAEDAELMRVG